MRRLWIHTILPLVFTSVPLLAAALLLVAVPSDARGPLPPPRPQFAHRLDYHRARLHPVHHSSRVVVEGAAAGKKPTSTSRTDRWLSHLAQGAEWFPLLGLIGTVIAILQTFATIKPGVTPQDIIQAYGPAITATGGGLYMAFINILPVWVVSVRPRSDSLAGGVRAGSTTELHCNASALAGGIGNAYTPRRSVTRFFIPLIDVLMLLFGIFILMPFVSGPAPTESETETKAPPKAPLPENVQELQKELSETRARIARMEKAAQERITDRLSVRVLQIDPKDGTLYYYDPNRREISTEIDALRSDRPPAHLATSGGGVKDILFLILYPENPQGFPTKKQEEDIHRWFRDVPHRFQ